MVEDYVNGGIMGAAGEDVVECVSCVGALESQGRWSCRSGRESEQQHSSTREALASLPQLGGRSGYTRQDFRMR